MHEQSNESCFKSLVFGAETDPSSFNSDDEVPFFFDSPTVKSNAEIIPSDR